MENQNPQNIQQMFEVEDIDLEFIDNHFGGVSPYWEKAQNFIIEQWRTPVDSLSEKQQKWANEILEDCVEKRIEG